MRFMTWLAVAIVAVVGIGLFTRQPPPASTAAPSEFGCPVSVSNRAMCSAAIARNAAIVAGGELQCAGPTAKLARFGDAIGAEIKITSQDDKQRQIALNAYSAIMHFAEQMPRPDGAGCSANMAAFEAAAEGLGVE